MISHAVGQNHDFFNINNLYCLNFKPFFFFIAHVLSIIIWFNVIIMLLYCLRKLEKNADVVIIKY